MAIPNKPVAIDIDAISLDTWVALEEMAEPGKQPKVRDMRAILISVLSEWTPQEVGALNLSEMQTILGQLTAATLPKPTP